jgi:hypothetical protein
MAVLAFVLTGALLVLAAVLLARRRTPMRPTHAAARHGGDEMSWLPVVMSDGGGSACGADAGAGCDGGGGD